MERFKGDITLYHLAESSHHWLQALLQPVQKQVTETYFEIQNEGPEIQNDQSV